MANNVKLELDGLGKLTADLQKAQEGQVDPKVTSFDALHAVIDYLCEMGVHPRLLRPLYDQMGSLADELQTTNRKPIREALDLAFAASTVDLLKGTGESLDHACRKVSRAMGGAVTPKQIREVRKNIRRRRWHPAAVSHYWFWLRAVQADTEETQGDNKHACQSAANAALNVVRGRAKAEKG